MGWKEQQDSRWANDNFELAPVKNHGEGRRRNHDEAWDPK